MKQSSTYRPRKILSGQVWVRYSSKDETILNIIWKPINTADSKSWYAHRLVCTGNENYPADDPGWKFEYQGLVPFNTWDMARGKATYIGKTDSLPWQLKQAVVR